MGLDIVYPEPGDKVEILAAPSYWHGALAIVQFIAHEQPVRKIAVYLEDDPSGKDTGLMYFGVGEVVPTSARYGHRDLSVDGG